MGSVNPIVGSARTRAVEAPSKKNNKTRIGTSGETVDSRKVHWFTRLYSCIQHCIIHTCSTRTKSRCIDTSKYVIRTFTFSLLSRVSYIKYICIYLSRMLFAKMQTLWNISIVLNGIVFFLTETETRSNSSRISSTDYQRERWRKNKRGYTIRCFSTVSDYQIFLCTI